MADVLKNYFSKFKEYLADETLITDLLSKVTITFGVILIIGGLYLMIINPITSTQATQLSQTAKSTVNTVSWIPGIPFNFDDLANFTSITVGSVSWILGVDMLLVGLGLWVRHRLARLAAIILFSLAALFQFIQFLFLGAIGSPMSIVDLCIDGLFVYLLFSKFDKQSIAEKVGPNPNLGP